MKAPAFWYKKNSLLSRALAPLGVLYRTGSLVRRVFARPSAPRIPVICVGNIVAGGAGKTPTAISIARLLLERGDRPVFVTRGYGGRMKGPLRVNMTMHGPAEVGDEALLLAGVAPCWIGRSRPRAIAFAEKEATHIILDDGLQNPNLKPDVSFLVVDGAVGFGNGKIFPAGPLRETLHDAFSRVAAIVMVGEDRQNVTYCLGKHVLKARLVPSLPLSFPKNQSVFAFAGIGRPRKFYDSCEEAGLIVGGTQDFPDHHFYTDLDIEALGAAAAKKNLRLITTAKDWVRLPEPFRKEVSVLRVDLVFEDEVGILNLLQSSTMAARAPS